MLSQYMSNIDPEHHTPEAWAYLSVSPHVKAVFVPQDDDTFELVILVRVSFS